MIESFHSLLTATNRFKSLGAPIPADPLHARALYKGSPRVERDDIVGSVPKARTALSVFR
jgi:hypothetical protein